MKKAIANLAYYAKILEAISFLKYDVGLDVSSTEKSFNDKFNINGSLAEMD